MSAPLGTVVIAAHQEEAVLARTLQHLDEVVRNGLLDVVVVCNGCTDATADVARAFGVRVHELAKPSKTAALRAGDRLALPGPRLYLDADVELTGRAAVATMRALSAGAIAGRPPHRFDVARSRWSVRRWYAVRERLPSIAGALWGAGCYGLSREGRARFGEFPEIVSDDLFVDGLFTEREVVIVATDPVIVHGPRTVADLTRILRRSYRSQHTDAPAHGAGPISAGQRAQLHDMLDLVRRHPARLVDVGVYLTLICLARVRARIGTAPRWERDVSSRSV
ncbi:glycosyltransferase family 2 protein [Ruania suaedae]|uniref:glycosyltransferase n=1 Tax=Ruania suaedae TaxID=2897774 RepID=UPI001E56E369|nr:glycosyltransferase family 2 protein [Ruania suaedae]UFU02382.1 glycosyltransferase family 2 protein [Ruania suaedae]